MLASARATPKRPLNLSYSYWRGIYLGKGRRLRARKRDAATWRAMLTAPASGGLSPGRVRAIAKRQSPAAIKPA